MKAGFYEQIITEALNHELGLLDNPLLLTQALDKSSGPIFMSRFFQGIILQAFRQIARGDEAEARTHMVNLANALINTMAHQLDDDALHHQKITDEGQWLKAFFEKAYFPHASLKDYTDSVFPSTGLSASELFNGSRIGISLDSELRKEMLSADEVWWLVSFIKFEGARLFDQVLRTLEQNGKPVKIICTVYMGATDLKAIDYLSTFSNVQIKISYDTRHERLHAKSYLFIRDSGFHTGYVGSSNLSRTALTKGLEWNVKMTSQEIPHVIDKCRSTFETYWNDSAFEWYDPEQHRNKLRAALQSTGNPADLDAPQAFFDIKPYPYQQEILDQLSYQRTLGHHRNLLVAATGTGKTIMAAFDFKRFRQANPTARFLFVAHREEILRQARTSFRHILKDHDFGSLWIGANQPDSLQHLFVTIQTLNNRIDTLGLAPDFYQYVIIDEVHHSAAASYQKLLRQFSPQLLLGLTATPERHDGQDITQCFGHTISAEIRLPEALNRGLLTPFHYFGVSDSVDLSRLSWRKGRYLVEELERVYTENHRRVSDIMRNCEKYLTNPHDVRALGFCASRKHAAFMAQQFNDRGWKAHFLSTDNASERHTILRDFRRKAFNYLFVVDIFNEGVDIPEVDTLLFLRPTESLTIFLQQLGRGLRLHEEKSCLTVLDFVGQQHAEYAFEHKFRGMIGKTHTRIRDEIRHDFPHLPLGCSIILEKEARETILNNINKALRGGLTGLLRAIRNFRQEYTLEPRLDNFCNTTGVDLAQVYRYDYCWYQLLQLADNATVQRSDIEKKAANAMGSTWRSSESVSYFTFIQHLLTEKTIDLSAAHDQQLLAMVCIDLQFDLKTASDEATLLSWLQPLFDNEPLCQEIHHYLAYRMGQTGIAEQDLPVQIPTALRLHGRYTRNQILAGFGESRPGTMATSREGVYQIKDKNTELLFVTLDKSEGTFNPGTMYHDYFINEALFHWQSQNKTTPSSAVGQSYIHQQQQGKDILLFVREATRDENGLTMAFISCGPLHYIRHEGSRPMSITWQLSVPPPPGLLLEGRKLAVG
jgi:superfamily II DNA or RNA helicase